MDIPKNGKIMQHKAITKLLILDIDGVMTDGKKTYDKNGRACYKEFCDRDFTAIKMFRAAGVDVVFLSGDSMNEGMANNRNIPFFCNRLEKKHNKSEGQYICKSNFVDLFVEKFGVKPNEMVYVGDDIFDIEIMKAVGRAFCPADANYMVKNVATQVLNKNGGDCVVEDVFNYHISVLEMEMPSMEKIIELDKQEKL
jgi:YrbI family 3-deoxy-D-manno-octulosonate 8-phosphate phosphatase